MNLDPVTMRWAEALFGLAKKQGVLADVGRDVERIGAEVANESVASYLFASGASRDERHGKLHGLLEDFHTTTKNFVDLLFERRRELVLRDVAVAFKRLSLEENGALEGHVESARKLGPAEVEQLEQAIGARLGKFVHLAPRVNPDLVGGVRVFVGANMIDFSVQGRLADLRQKLLEAPLPAASA